MTERTIFDLYRHDVRSARPDHYAMFAPGVTWALSTDEFFATTSALADGLAGLGVRRGDRVLLLSDNRPEWHMADLAVLSLEGGHLTPTLKVKRRAVETQFATLIEEMYRERTGE